jgi:hypothetical protein
MKIMPLLGHVGHNRASNFKMKIYSGEQYNPWASCCGLLFWTVLFCIEQGEIFSI